MFEWFFGSGQNTYEIESDMFYPHDARTISYTGTHPSRILSKIGKLLKDTYRIQGADTYEDDFRWDIANPKIIKFFVKWRCKKKLDMRSIFWSVMVAQGEIDKKTGDGWIKLAYKGKIITKIPFTTSFDKALKHLYFRKFYIKQLRSYSKKMMTLLNDFDENVRTMYNIAQTEVKEEER